MSKTRVILAISVPIALLLASSLRVHPGKVAERSTWDVRSDTWHYRNDRVSLIDVARQGFIYSPVVADGEIRHTRQPAWLLLYLLVVPLSVLAVYCFLYGMCWLIRQIALSFQQLWANRFRKLLVGYVGLSIMVQIMSVYELGLGPGGSDSVPVIVFQFTKDPLEMFTLPVLFANHLIVFLLTQVNYIAYSNTSPALAFADVPRYRQIFGPYPFGGFLWESLCVVILLAFWTLTVPRISQLPEQVFRKLKDA